MERLITAEIETAIARGEIDLSRERVIMAANAQWPIGLVGLIASRLVAAYDRPAVLFHVGADGVARGSARSIPAFDIFEALGQCATLLNHFGGHAGAAGLSLAADNIGQLKNLLEERMATCVSADDLVAKITIDTAVSLADITGKFVDDVAYLEPCGCMNPCPVLHVSDVTLLEEPRLLKDAHVKCRIYSQGIIKPVIFFNRPELIKFFEKIGDQPFDLAVEIVENYWQGTRSIELRGIDVAWRGN
jgi:single-stranded-DNA-specific exonuclease